MERRRNIDKPPPASPNRINAENNPITIFAVLFISSSKNFVLPTCCDFVLARLNFVLVCRKNSFLSMVLVYRMKDRVVAYPWIGLRVGYRVGIGDKMQNFFRSQIAHQN
jgi:hypothetical protein